MKKIIFSVLLSVTMITTLHAQRVWTEGTVWDITYTTEAGTVNKRFELVQPVTVGEHTYFPLVETTAEGSHTLGYVRTERGDTLVYARVYNPQTGELLGDRLLYDFTRPYEPGSVVRYGLSDRICEVPINEENGTITYYRDVLEDGDCLPAYAEVIYLLGATGGPFSLFLDSMFDPTGINGGAGAAKSTNVSHIIFGTKSRAQSVLTPASTTVSLTDGSTYRSFAFRLMSEVEQQQEKPASLVMSPLSAWLALGMLQNGASGNTLSEMKQAMGTTGLSAEQLNAFNAELMQSFKSIANPETWSEGVEYYSAASAPALETANSIWSDTGFPFYDAFYNVNTQSYEAELQTVDLSLQSSMDAVDSWVNEKTHGNIPSVRIQPSDDLCMLLVNALYFKGSWKTPFYAFFTRDEPFYNYGTEPVSVPTMHQEEYMDYAHTDGYQVVRLYYNSGGRLSMTLFLPDDTQVLKPFTAELWKEACSQLAVKRILLSLPRFSTDSDLSLKDVMKAMGMIEAFNGNEANFSLLSPRQVFVAMMKQLAHVEVDEEGTTAAAVTVIGMGNSGFDVVSPLPVTFNRPFYYTIEDNKTGAILFMGHVVSLDKEDTAVRQVTARDAQGALYDLTGRRLMAPPSKGLYICNGRLVGAR